MAGAASEIHVYAPRIERRNRALAALTGFFAPSLSDFFFLAVLAWLFMAGHHGWSSLLADADTGWHIRAGQYMLQHGAVPRQDLFSFSRAGQPWFAWEWLSDVIFAGAFGAFGFKGIVLLAGAMIGLFATMLLRYCLWRGANGFVALTLTLIAAGAATIHFLARPHLFTLVLFLGSVWLLDADRRRRTRAVWFLPLITVLWTNLHGGFVILIVWLCALGAAAAIESWWNRTDFVAARRYGALALACAAATIVNPYGIRLHQHLVSYLGSGWIRDVVQEFQAPTFRGESQFQFELLLVAAIAVAGIALTRRDVTTALTVGLFAHMSLTSARHIPLFMVVAAPAVAVELTRVWRSTFGERSRKTVAGIIDQLANDVTPKLRRASALVPAALLIMLLAPLAISWPDDFPEELFPVHLISRNAGLLQSARVFTTDQWGDYLIFHYWPRTRVFLDGRTDFYGKDLGTQYIRLLHGEPGWRGVLTKYGFTAVLTPPDMPLAALLRDDGGWRAVAQDKRAVLFVRADQGVSPSSAAALLRPGGTARAGGLERFPGGTQGQPQPNENLRRDRSITQETRPS